MSQLSSRAFECYVEVLALKKHFTDSRYDYHRYGGKVRASYERFQTKPDAHFYSRLAQKSDWRDVSFANILENSGVFVRDLLSDRARSVYLGWKGRQDSLHHLFATDIKKLGLDYEAALRVPTVGHPLAVKKVSSGDISLETATILSDVAGVADYWSDKLRGDPVAEKLLLKMKKYSPFLSYDKSRCTEAIKDYFF